MNNMTQRKRSIRKAALLLAALLAVGAPLTAQSLKIASLAPDGSPWDKALKRLALEWQQVSGGRVTVKIYGGGIAGDEPDMLRKMRINQIQGAAMTGSGSIRGGAAGAIGALSPPPDSLSRRVCRASPGRGASRRQSRSTRRTSML